MGPYRLRSNISIFFCIQSKNLLAKTFTSSVKNANNEEVPYLLFHLSQKSCPVTNPFVEVRKQEEVADKHQKKAKQLNENWKGEKKHIATLHHHLEARGISTETGILNRASTFPKRVKIFALVLDQRRKQLNKMAI